MNLDWVAGFIEGNGSFSIGFIKSSSIKLKYQIKPTFVLKISKSEVPVLERIRRFFGGIGNIYYDMGESVSFRVTKLDEVKKIVKLLKSVRFVSENKKRDFENWAKCIGLIEKKQHLTKDGFLKIALIRDLIHRKQQWNKKHYCVIKNSIDPCQVFLKEKKIPAKCDIYEKKLQSLLGGGGRMRVYLDNGATTKVDPDVAKVMQVYLTEKYGNASSLHDFGAEAKEALENSRKTIAKAIDAKRDEIIFTSCGSESNNTVLKGVAFSKGKGHIITTKIEHPCIIETCKYLAKKGFEITYLDVDKDGFIDLEQLKNSIKEDTILVSVIHANNEVGTINDLVEIGKICKEKNILFHSDCVQSFTKVPIDVNKLNLSFASFSAHKIHGQKGVGALFIRKGVMIDKLIHGGHQEKDLRAGTENVAGIVGLAKAVKLAMDKKHIMHMTLLRDKLIEKIERTIPDVKLNGSRSKRLCNNVNFSFLGVEGESIGALLNVKGITSSTGSACSSQSLDPSHVLMAMGLTHEEAQGSIRLTLSRFTTMEEVDYVLEKLPKIIQKLRKISPIVKFVGRL